MYTQAHYEHAGRGPSLEEDRDRAALVPTSSALFPRFLCLRGGLSLPARSRLPGPQAGERRWASPGQRPTLPHTPALPTRAQLRRMAQACQAGWAIPACPSSPRQCAQSHSRETLLPSGHVS